MIRKKYEQYSLSNEFIKVKHRGKVFTPDYLVIDILNQGHYVEGNINKKHVIDNSCGDGQFMIHIVDRYCKDYLKINNNLKELKNQLEMYIHTIEIEKKALDICKQRCEKVANMYGIFNVNWDFINGDAMKITKFNGMMDFVLGNPPYVRVHNLDKKNNSIKNFAFSNIGMTDLYIVFYELGIKMLSKTGILSYITPSSFFTSVAGSNMRQYLNSTHILESLCDLKHFQPFNATTYTAIVCLNKSKKNTWVDYYEFDTKKLTPFFVERLDMNDYSINNNYYFSKKKNIQLLKNILLLNMKKSDITVKNGFATLADKVFIKDFDFESRYIIPVVKASKGKWSKILYPYDKKSKLVKEKKLKQDKKVYEYLLFKKLELLDRTSENDTDNFWYAFGRSQAINDTYKRKIAINTLIRDTSDLKIIDVPSGSGVYSGLYIISNSISRTKIKRALLDKEFGIYTSLLGKYKSGGYYTFSSKDLEHYLNYKLNDRTNIQC